MTGRNDVPLDNSTAWALYSNTAYAPKLPDSTASGFIDVWGGEFTKTIKGDTSAWKHDNNLLLVRYDLRSKAYNITFADNSITTMRGNFYKFVDAYKAAGGTPGALITYRDERWTIDETAKILYGAATSSVCRRSRLRTTRTKCSTRIHRQSQRCRPRRRPQGCRRAQDAYRFWSGQRRRKWKVDSAVLLCS